MESLADKLTSAEKGTFLMDEADEVVIAEVTSFKDADEVILVAKSEEFFFVVRDLLKSVGFGCDERSQEQSFVCYLFLTRPPYRVRLVWSGTALPDTAPSSQS